MDVLVRCGRVSGGSSGFLDESPVQSGCARRRHGFRRRRSADFPGGAAVGATDRAVRDLRSVNRFLQQRSQRGDRRDHRRSHPPANSSQAIDGSASGGRVMYRCRWECVFVDGLRGCEGTPARGGKGVTGDVKLCARGDLNPYVRGHQNLNLARLPISPLALDGTTVQTLPALTAIAKLMWRVSYSPVTRPGIITVLQRST